MPRRLLEIFIATFLWLSSSPAQANICNKVDSIKMAQQTACEFELEASGCHSYRTKLLEKSDDPRIAQNLISCDGKKNSARPVVSCASSAIFLAAVATGSVVLSTTAGVIAFAGGILAINSTLNADKECYENIALKKSLIENYNNDLKEIETYLGMTLQEAHLNNFSHANSEKIIKELSCADLKKYILEKRKMLQLVSHKLGVNYKISEGVIDSLFNDFFENIANVGIHVSCLKPEVKLQMFCDALSLGAGAASLGKNPEVISKYNYLKAELTPTEMQAALGGLLHKKYSTQLPTEKTRRSLPADANRVPEGKHVTNATEKGLVEALAIEEHAAESLARAGFKVEYKMYDPKAKRSADLTVEGNVFDVYAPKAETSVHSVLGHITHKARKGQSSRIVLDLSRSPHAPVDLKKQMIAERIDMNQVREVIGVTKSGEVITLFPP